MKQFTDLGKRGINIGNALDYYKECTVDTESYWENPHTTREMVHMYADAGFDILRLPVTWGMHMGGAPDYKVDPAWMARVREVVGWALETGKTVILDAHHENSWTRPELNNLTDTLPKHRSLWQQIAAEFAEVGDQLVMQGSNEPNLDGGENCQWGSGTRNIREAVNALNHTFVRTVREMGGNNATRWLAIPNLAGRPLPDCMADMIMPDDDRLIYTIHPYVPDRFVFSRETPENTPFFDQKGQDEVRAMFMDFKRYAVPHGLPIIFTEMGAVRKLLPDGKTYNDDERIAYVKFLNSCADELGAACIWWDNNYFTSGDEYFALFDRQTLKCHTPALLAAFLETSR